MKTSALAHLALNKQLSPLQQIRPTVMVSLLVMAASSTAFAQQAADDKKTVESATVSLKAIAVEADPDVITEGTGTYNATRATVGYRQPVDIRRAPQTVNVLTRQQIEDGGVNSIEEAAVLLPSLTTATGNGFAGSLYSRGHEVFTYNIDGAPRPFLSLYGTAPDLVFFDRLEVLSGPSGVFQGSGEPVGTINLVRKRAPEKFAGHVGLRAGSHGMRRIEADLGGGLNKDGSIRGRIIGYGMDQDSHIDFAGRKRSGFSGTLEFDLGSATTVSVGGISERNDVSSHSGLPTYADGTLLNVDSATFIGAPWNANNGKSNEGFLEVEHEFANGAVLKTSARTYKRETDIKVALASSSVDRTTGDFSAMVFARDWEESTNYVDVNVSVPFSVAGKKSEFAIGADYRDTDQTRLQNFDFSPGTQNINSFDANALLEPSIVYPGVGPGFRLNTVTRSEESGVYAYTRVALSQQANLSLGGRFANYDSTVTDTGRGTVTAVKESRFVPSLGLTYDLSSAATGYIGLSQIFQPQSELDANGGQLQPLIGSQVEVGVKFASNDGGITGQAAVFQLDDKHRAQDDPLNAGASVANGQARTRGFEGNVAGRLSASTLVSLGYAYVSTDLTTDPTPAHRLALMVKYSPQQGGLRGWHGGLRARIVSKFEATSGGTTVKAPGYGVADMFFGYKISKMIEAGLSINNVLDRTYVNRVIDTTRGVFYGEPRSAMLTVKATF